MLHFDLIHYRWLKLKQPLCKYLQNFQYLWKLYKIVCIFYAIRYKMPKSLFFSSPPYFSHEFQGVVSYEVLKVEYLKFSTYFINRNKSRLSAAMCSSVYRHLPARSFIIDFKQNFGNHWKIYNHLDGVVNELQMEVLYDLFIKCVGWKLTKRLLTPLSSRYLVFLI